MARENSSPASVAQQHWDGGEAYSSANALGPVGFAFVNIHVRFGLAPPPLCVFVSSGQYLMGTAAAEHRAPIEQGARESAPLAGASERTGEINEFARGQRPLCSCQMGEDV
jgi:hypothetical protein